MTRRRQNIRLLIVIVVLLVIIAVALFAKFQNGNALFDKLYEFIRDTSLLIATIAVAYLANIYQRRQQFLMSLREQWREIVQAKSALLLQNSNPTHEQYLRAAAQLSECIDYMRIVYANVGETAELIGYYPFEPLHDMRHVFKTLDPTVASSNAIEDVQYAEHEIGKRSKRSESIFSMSSTSRSRRIRFWNGVRGANGSLWKPAV
jgi:hypothetical protein